MGHEREWESLDGPSGEKERERGSGPWVGRWKELGPRGKKRISQL